MTDSDTETAVSEEIITALSRDDDCAQYWSAQGEPWRLQASGYSVIRVLEFLNGLPLSNLILAYVAGMHPSYVRITDGVRTANYVTGRLTIVVVRKEHVTIVQHIEQELCVGYGSGCDVAKALQEAKNNVKR